jgi:hypothetical protein
MDIVTFLALILIGYLGTMLVLGSLIWLAVKLWRRLTGNPAALADLDDTVASSHRQTGFDAAREHAAQALRSHPGPLP